MQYIVYVRQSVRQEKCVALPSSFEVKWGFRRHGNAPLTCVCTHDDFQGAFTMCHGRLVHLSCIGAATNRARAISTPLRHRRGCKAPVATAHRAAAGSFATSPVNRPRQVPLFVQPTAGSYPCLLCTAVEWEQLACDLVMAKECVRVLVWSWPVAVAFPLLASGMQMCARRGCHTIMRMRRR